MKIEDHDDEIMKLRVQIADEQMPQGLRNKIRKVFDLHDYQSGTIKEMLRNHVRMTRQRGIVFPDGKYVTWTGSNLIWKSS
jgi:hypothetical protein